jgi:signal transduction histidine kinase
VAVLDVTGPVAAADPVMGVMVEGLAAALEGLLRVKIIDDLATRIEALELQSAAVRHDRDNLAEALRLHETFLATVGHDLRSPLAAVLNGAELLARGEDSRYRFAAERIRSSGRRMVGLVDQLTDLARARLGGGIRAGDRDRVDLVSVGERVIDEVRAAHPGADIRLDASGDGTGFWEEGRIAQAVSNLVGNAVRHGDAARPVYAKIDGDAAGTVALTVTNAGEIDPSILPFIFDPFRTTKSQRMAGDGLGLGLYIAHQVVRAHHGDIDVMTRQGTTTFRVILPRRARVAPYPV